MSRKSCYCAFCKSPRKVYTKRRVNLFNILASAFGSSIVMFAVWQGFDPKVFLIFVAFLAVAEGFVQIRWRINIVCKHCGFDPVLYLKDHSKAAEKVRVRLEQRRNDPASLLAKPLNLPKISKEQSEKLQKQNLQSPAAKDSRGSLISRQI